MLNISQCKQVEFALKSRTFLPKITHTKILRFPASHTHSLHMTHNQLLYLFAHFSLSLPPSYCAAALFAVTFSLYLLLLHLSISVSYLPIWASLQGSIKWKWKRDGGPVVRKTVLQPDESGLSSCTCKPSSSSLSCLWALHRVCTGKQGSPQPNLTPLWSLSV